MNAIPIAPPGEVFTWLSLPLLKLEQAAKMLDDVDTRHVTHLAEEGKLRAINIACGSQRRCWRVWRYSVEWLAEGGHRALRHPQDFDIAELLPKERSNFRIDEVAKFLQCDTTHVRHLMADPQAGLLLKGPQFSERHRRITRAGLIEFLTTREEGCASR